MNNKRNTATETYITYAPETDMTFIMKGVIDADTLEHISDECIGWSYGKITISEALNMEHSLKAEYIMADEEEADEEEAEARMTANWKVVREYVDTSVREEYQAKVLEQLYADDDFCNALARCEDHIEIEVLLDNKLF